MLARCVCNSTAAVEMRRQYAIQACFHEPVFLGALTTIPGVATLLADPFFRSMAVTILFGVAFATILPIVVVPLLYAVVFRVSSDPAFENVRGRLVQPILGRTMGDTIHKKSRP